VQALACEGRGDIETQCSCSQFQQPLRTFFNTICKDKTQLPLEEEAGRTLWGSPSPQRAGDRPSLQAEMGMSWSWLRDTARVGCAAAPGGDKLALAEQLMSCFELRDGLDAVGCSLPTSPAENRAKPEVLQPSTVAEPRTPSFLLHPIV